MIHPRYIGMRKDFMGRYFPALTGESSLSDPETIESIIQIFRSQKWKHTALNESEHYFQLGNKIADFWFTDSAVELFIPRNVRRNFRYCVVALTVKDHTFNLSLVKGAANEHSDYVLTDSAFAKEAFNTVSESNWVLQSTSTNSYRFDEHSLNHPKEFKRRV